MNIPKMTIPMDTRDYAIPPLERSKLPNHLPFTKSLPSPGIKSVCDLLPHMVIGSMAIHIPKQELSKCKIT